MKTDLLHAFLLLCGQFDTGEYEIPYFILHNGLGFLILYGDLFHFSEQCFILCDLGREFGEQGDGSFVGLLRHLGVHDRIEM